MDTETEFKIMEETITEELVDTIESILAGEKKSTIKDIQPVEAVVHAMAEAAAKVLISFEHGYRIDG